MVGIVIVSHSGPLAEAAADLARLMAKKVKIAPAGGMEDGGFGTSYDKIDTAIREVYSDDGVLILADMGSSVMTAQLVMDDLEDEDMKICMADAPVVEGAVAAAVSAEGEASLEEVKEAAEEAGRTAKF